MSLTKTQIDSLIDRNCKTDSVSYSVADKTEDENLAIDDILGFMFPRGGTWQLDDSNHTDDPIIMTNLVSGQRSYTFDTDEQGNIILDIHRIMVADDDGTYYDLIPKDQQTPDSENSNTDGFVNGKNATGRPIFYDKTGNNIILDPIPNYSQLKGLKVFISREASYFTSSDTTKKLGFAQLFHEYIALRPSYMYAYRNNLSNVGILQNEMLRMQEAIKLYYGTREKDVKKRFISNIENNK